MSLSFLASSHVRIFLKNVSWPAPTYETHVEFISIDLPISEENAEKVRNLLLPNEFAKCTIIGAEFKE